MKILKHTAAFSSKPYISHAATTYKKIDDIGQTEAQDELFERLTTRGIFDLFHLQKKR